MHHAAVHEIAPRMSDKRLITFGLALQSGRLIDDQFWKIQIEDRFGISTRYLSEFGLRFGTHLNLYKKCVRIFRTGRAQDKNDAALLVLMEYPDIDLHLVSDVDHHDLIELIDRTSKNIFVHIKNLPIQTPSQFRNLIRQYGHLHWWKRNKTPVPLPVKELLELPMKFDNGRQDGRRFLVAYMRHDIAEISKWLPLWHGESIWVLNRAEDFAMLSEWSDRVHDYIRAGGHAGMTKISNGWHLRNGMISCIPSFDH